MVSVSEAFVHNRALSFLERCDLTNRTVPYVEKKAPGAVTGIVGGGGNAGAVVFSLMFRELDYHTAFLWMGVAVMCSSVVTGFIMIRGESAMFFGNENSVGSLVDDEEYGEEVEALKHQEEDKER